ncbi:hypothetical protein U5N28_11090 [Lysinibacillus telephonicus]|uniref:hypothetical protein n=1 Tax=Lysinibacillus telephonicus TaxID=1714840 RepID=UPI00397D2A7F
MKLLTRNEELEPMQLNLGEKPDKYLHHTTVYYDHLKYGDITPFIKLINSLKNNGDINNSRCSCTINFRKYPKEDGKKEFDYDLIRNWVQKLYERIPHFFYYLTEIDTLEPTRNIFLSMASIQFYQVNGQKVENIVFFEEETRQIALDIYKTTIAYEKKIHGANSRELKETLERVLRPFL